MVRLTRFFTGAVLCAVTLVPARPAESAPSVYVVRSGDSLYAIASRLDVRLDDLLRANRLTLTSVILPGQRLTVPGSGGTDSGSATYAVRPGDWLGRIASRHGITLRALLAANNLSVNSVILPGQRLVVPGADEASSGGDGRGYTTYVVRSGDWLSRIASRHGVELRSLLDANGLNVNSLIVPGQSLRVPRRDSSVGSPAPAAPPAAGDTYTVRAGDSLAAIASRHGVPLNALLAVNEFNVNTLITPGMSLRLPSGAPSRRVDRVVDYALAQVGKPWRFFARGPAAFDCSGLTLAAYEQAGVRLLHYSAAQAWQGTAVNFYRDPIRAGDLIFQDTDHNGVVNHVGIAISATRWVQARDSRTDVVVSTIPPDNRIVAVRRMLPNG